ncbi:MAG: hypothetical protein ABI600_09295 [Luteolibacter sp.]
MILLTVIAVGLLSLSAISLRGTSSESAMAEARASARLSLMLALNQLQMELGPDQRISTTADQIPKSNTDGTDTGAQAQRRYWAGVYNSWTASTSLTDARPTPNFRSWLVSGSSAPTAIPSASDIELVGKGTLGSTATKGFVSVPFMDCKTSVAGSTHLAWWVGDQGVKAAISNPQAANPGSDRALVRAGLQGAPRNAVQLAKAGTTAPFASLAASDPNLAKVTDWQQAGFLASAPKDSAPLFHDLASDSYGLLTNVRSGGFRKDLSMYLETAAPPTAGFPAPLVGNGALYQVAGQDGIRIGELWSYYNLYKQLKTTSVNFTTGGTASGASNPYLQAEGTLAAAKADNFFYYKRPVIISYKALFSFYIRPGASPKQLCFVVDPVVTFWNPYDVPIALFPAYNSIRFLKIPYQINNLKMTANGIISVIGNIKLGGVDKTSFGGQFAANYVTLRAGQTNPVIMKPGEVLLYAQPPSTLPQQADASGGVTTVDGKAGYNFGGGIYYTVKNSSNAVVTIPAAATASTSQQVILTFDSITPTADVITQGVAGASPVSVNHCETYLFEDRKQTSGPFAGSPYLGIGGTFVDFWRGQFPYTAVKSSRFTADGKLNAFKSAAAGSVTVDALATATNDLKKPFLYYSYDAKTEEDSLRPGQFLNRFNPSAPLVDFGDLSDTELAALPFEIKVESNTSSALNSVIDQEPGTGRGYFGGGTTGNFGSTFVTTHSVPREPLISLAALQHSMANGFNCDKPDDASSYGLVPTANQFSNMTIRMPMLPQIAHAIGNSLAPAVLPMGATEGALSVGRPLADHSYLANKALWDDWFFSGIAPRDTGVNPSGLSQKNLASSFFDSTQNPPVKLPTARYAPNIGSETPIAVVNRLFSGTAPAVEATNLVGSLLRVEGMFNINSTSVEAWKSVLGGLKEHPVVVRDQNGNESVAASTDAPVTSLHAPTAGPANGANMDVKDGNQWTGRRSLADTEIQILAEKLVEEVRKRGPFISLADFVNRRPGSDPVLARAGAVQSAIDAAGINKGYDSRKVTSASAGIAFPAAETGSPAAQGAPGIVKQGDVLTPIAPILSARSDSFVIRGYGEKRDASGKVLARAWCEALVERGRDFVDPINPPETVLTSLNTANTTFGRRFNVRSFRWLNSSEI